MEAFSVALTNRSLRTVKTELDFLAENGTITQAQLSTILSQLPSDTAGGTAGGRAVAQPTPNAPIAAMNGLNLTNGHATSNGNPTPEKGSNGYYNPAADTAPPPPAYPATPQPPAPPLAHATALYAYNGGDTGDLALQANDRIAVTEYMNADWWKGRNERTGQEGIFPRNYVKMEEKGAPSGPSSYGNMPMQVAQNGPSQPQGEGKAGKGSEMGKKFGKKLGNAAIFGAGATVGSNIVNSIF